MTKKQNNKKMNGMSIKIKKWGNGNGILLPKALLDMLSLKVDDYLAVEMEEDRIILSPIKRKGLTLAQRFSNYNEVEKQQEYYLDDETLGKEMI